MQIATIGLDIAKNVFQVHGILLRRILPRRRGVNRQRRREKDSETPKPKNPGKRGVGLPICSPSCLLPYPRVSG